MNMSKPCGPLHKKTLPLDTREVVDPLGVGSSTALALGRVHVGVEDEYL